MDDPGEPGSEPPDNKDELSSESLLNQARQEITPTTDFLTEGPLTSLGPGAVTPGPAYQYEPPATAIPPPPAPATPASPMPPTSMPPIAPVPAPPSTPPPIAPRDSGRSAPPPPAFLQTPQRSAQPGSPGQPPRPAPGAQAFQATSPPPPPKLGSNKKIWWGVIAALAAGLLIGIGALRGSSEQREVETAISEAFDEAGIEPDDVTLELTRDEERCLQQEGVTRAAVIEAYSASDSSALDSQENLLNATLICAPRVVDDSFWIEQMAASFSVGLGTDLSTGEMKCTVLSAIDQNPNRPADVLIGNDEPGLLNAIEACFTEETMAILRGDPGTGPQDYGDDQGMDQLFDLCSQGRDPACDILFTMASTGSEYGLLSEDCAGRGLKSAFFCTAGLDDLNGDGWADDFSAAMIAGVDECTNGDMLSCDMLFALSELDSEYTDFAATCGERRVLATATCLGQYGLTAE